MTLPESLPARLYLLAYDTDQNRLTSRTQLGLVLRAAALTDLYLAGRVTDDNGRVRASDDRRFTGDPLLDELQEQIAEHRPRPWHRWIARDERGTVRTVRAQLEAARVIKVEPRVILPDRVELRDRHEVKRYAEHLRAELRRPAARAEPRTAAVLALAARGEVKTLISRRDRREHRRKLDELAVYTGPIADALRKAVQTKRAATVAAS